GAGGEKGVGGEVVTIFNGGAGGEKGPRVFFPGGRATLVVGTHTHAPPADDRVLPAGTAFMSDVGMTADYDSIIGMNKDEPLNRFLRKLPGAKFEASNGPATLSGLAVQTNDATGLACKLGAVRVGCILQEARAKFWEWKVSIARLTANRGDDSLDDVDSPVVLGSGTASFGTGLHEFSGQRQSGTGTSSRPRVPDAGPRQKN